MKLGYTKERGRTMQYLLIGNLESPHNDYDEDIYLGVHCSYATFCV